MHFMQALDLLAMVRHPGGTYMPGTSSPPETGMEAMTTKTPPSSQQAGGPAAAVLQVAERLYAMSPEWVIFFREVLGVDGIVRRTFSDAESLARFECSPQYARIREMLDALRGRQRQEPLERESQRVVTVRMPRSLHESLKAEAGDLRVSINTLCISKLMRALDEMAAPENQAAPTSPEAEGCGPRVERLGP
jgi:predicted HicB family RNase H-like nuclease